MSSKFNIVRAGIYGEPIRDVLGVPSDIDPTLGVVLLWTSICLAIAAHFQSLLFINDLTRFVPFAIFVCSVSILVLFILLGCSVLRTGNPISARIELGCLGLLGTLWLALGAYLASSESENANVECFSSAGETTLVDVTGFSMDTYRAQYRVLEAFSLFNVILIWEFLLFLLIMAVIQDVWLIAVTSYSWFGLNPKAPELPIPVVSRSRSRGRACETEDQTDGDDNDIDEVTLQRQTEEEMGRRDVFTFTVPKTGLRITNPS